MAARCAAVFCMALAAVSLAGGRSVAWAQTGSALPGPVADVPAGTPAAVAPAAVAPAGSLPAAASMPAVPAPPAAAPAPATVMTANSAVASAVPARLPIARVTAGTGVLPNNGQIWREYDISPYTLRVTSTNRPEQAIVDWVLRETGYETWHSEPLGILSATPRVLRVYHTPAVQAVVGEIVDRFVNSETDTNGFSLRVMTVDSPAWRARVQRYLVPVQVQTPGTQAWLLEKEGAAQVLADLRRRTDFREHNSPHLLINNGQPAVVQAKQGRSYIRGLVARPEVYPGFERETGLIDEGFALELSPLLSLDGRMVEATIKCEIDQVEKLLPVMLDVSTATAPRQRTKIEVPQVCQFRFHERFRWPVEQVLLIGAGVVAAPTPTTGSQTLVPGIPLPLGGTPRAELLVMVESKGKAVLSPRLPSAAGAPPGVSRPR